MMSEISLEHLEELMEKLCSLISVSCDTPTGLKERYQLLLRTVSVAIWKKFKLTEILGEDEESAEEFTRKAREGVNRGLHYEERRLYRLLAEPELVQVTRKALEKVEIILEETKRFEYILKSYFEVMKIDLKLSFEGHE